MKQNGVVCQPVPALLLFIFRCEYLISGPNSYRDFRETGPRPEKGRLYTGYSLGEHRVFSALVSSFIQDVLFTSWLQIRIHNRQSLKYYRLSDTSWKIRENVAVWFNNKSQGFLLMLVESFKPENLAFFPQRIFRHIFPSIFARSTQQTCALLLWIYEVNCDWSLTADVSKIFSLLGFADGFSRLVKLEPKKPDPLARYEKGVWKKISKRWKVGGKRDAKSYKMLLQN